MKGNALWAGGAMLRVREIQREMAQQIQPLQAKLRTETDKAQRTELKRQIKEIRKEYLQRERDANYSLFNRH